MQSRGTRERFKKRVEFERKVLTIINKNFTEGQTLNGLSEAAISVWKSSNGFLGKDELLSMIQSLSCDLMLFSDTSRNTFDLDKRVNSSKIETSISELELYVINHIDKK